ncbi:MAG TPA: DUF4388 domain-containing protein [Mycobacteriales bacterium]|jgi:hypothetical protein|nr:DUF4388 domain-containing protein [Mycobacteriales bacterium]
MTLEGSLDAFSLPDIFQLLSFTKKTGALRITGPAAQGVVHFATGSVTGAASDVHRQALARRLVGAGLLDDAQLAQAIEAVANDPALGIGKAAHDAGLVDDGVLHEHVVEQATDAVFDLLRWTRGDFAFVSNEPNPDDLGVSLNVEEVITEGRRRLEEWESLTKAVPAPDAVVSVVLKPASDDTAVTADEWSVLALADGRRTVADLVRLTGRGEFATVKTLAGLVDRRLVAVRRGDDGNDSVAALLRRQRELSALEGRPEPAEPDPEPEPAPAVAERPRPEVVPDVVPQRPEPMVARKPEFPEEPVSLPGARRPASAVRTTTETEGSAAVATETVSPLIERDPSVNKSLLLRLIAGVRGL